MAVLIAGQPADNGRTWLRWLPIVAERGVLPAIVIWRVLLLTAGVRALQVFPNQPGDGAWVGSPNAPWLAALSRWDGKWYLAIAQQGYGYREGPASSMNFAPAYPALIRLVGSLLGRTDRDALAAIGIILSNVLLVFAVVALYVLAKRTEGESLAPRAVLWLAVVPSTFFLSAVYPESLFMALALGAFLCALDGRWVLAGVLGACAAVTRDYGVVLLVPLGWEYLQQHRCRPSRDIAWLLLIPAAFTGWQVYLWILSGDPLAMSHAAEDWGRRLTAPWDMFRYYLSPKYWETFIVSRGAVHDDRTPLDLVATLLLGILVALSWRLQRRSLAVLATVLYLPMISTGGFVSIPRYGLEVFPIYLVLARMTARGWMLVPALVVSAVVAVVAMSWFAVGGWIA